MKSILAILIMASGLTINIHAMSLNNQATCGMIFSMVSIINREQGNLRMMKKHKQKMLDMINNMRDYGYDDDTITKAIATNMPNALKIMKSAEYDEFGYKKYVNRCLDELEK